MNNTIKFFVDRNNSDLRVDIYLSNEIEKLTRSYIQKIIKNNKVKINNEIVNSPSIKVKTGDKIIINLTDQSNQNNIIANNIKLNIIFEDKDILIIDKPKGMIVHPGAGNSESTLANALQYKFKKNLSDINGVLRPGIVHRIDKDTSGLLVVAKNNLSHNFLADQFKKHTIDRKYLCLVWGVIRPLKGRIETLISRNKRNRYGFKKD